MSAQQPMMKQLLAQGVAIDAKALRSLGLIVVDVGHDDFEHGFLNRIENHGMYVTGHGSVKIAQVGVQAGPD